MSRSFFGKINFRIIHFSGNNAFEEVIFRSLVIRENNFQDFVTRQKFYSGKGMDTAGETYYGHWTHAYILEQDIQIWGRGSYDRKCLLQNLARLELSGSRPFQPRNLEWGGLASETTPSYFDMGVRTVENNIRRTGVQLIWLIRHGKPQWMG